MAAFLLVFVLSFIERFCLAGLPLRLVRSAHSSSIARLADQFATAGKTDPRQPSSDEALRVPGAYGQVLLRLSSR